MMLLIGDKKIKMKKREVREEERQKKEKKRTRREDRGNFALRIGVTRKKNKT